MEQACKKWFATLDPSSSFWQIEVGHMGRHNTVFKLPSGLFEFTTRPKGLVNSVYKLAFRSSLIRNRNKYTFLQSFIPFLGHTFSSTGSAAEPVRWDTNNEEVPLFLSLTSHYLAFFSSYCRFALPSIRLREKALSIIKDHRMQRGTPILAYPGS